MYIAVIGGAGAMGSLFGGLLAQSGNTVTLIDVMPQAVDTINTHGLQIEQPDGASQPIHIHATTDPATVAPVDLALVFVKCYHTESALTRAMPLIGPTTVVLSLQNGWGNAPRIASMVGVGRVMVGVTYHSSTLLEAGRVLHAGHGPTYIGELDGHISDRLQRVAKVLTDAGIDTTPRAAVLNDIWAKLALNVCTLPTSALLRFRSGQLIAHDATQALMRALLHEVAVVAQAQGITINEDERWEAISGVLTRASSGRSSMLQDVEKQRRTEIAVINGAIVAAGQRLNIPTPYNDSMVWLITALESTFQTAGEQATV